MSYVHAFDQPLGMSPADAKAVIGGKAANLSVMATELHLPVPPGFAISTSACNEFLAGGWPDGLDDEIREHMRRVETAVGRRFGDVSDPLLVSVRSGAPVSMPGMMDTILNLGLTDRTVAGLAAASGDAAFAANCHARFRKMYREIVGTDTVPEDPWVQLRGAVEAVFRSWNSDRARAYRHREGIPDDLGTAVTVQTMVFGNRGADSATGVLFTRNPATGENVLFGDVMFNAQGEDVVAGTHATQPITVLDERLPKVARQLREYAGSLERYYADLCDIEFTIERGRLWMLQVRVGKRTPQAALRIAAEMAEDESFPLTREQAVARVAEFLANPPRVSVGRPAGLAPLTRGLGASPGVVAGEIVTSPDAAVEAADAGRKVILVRAETSPDDVHGMAKAVAILTATGGLASHAAVVARGWGIPAVVGASAVAVREDGISIDGRAFATGQVLTIDGATGEVFKGAVAGDSVPVPEAATLAGWARELGIALPGAGGRREEEEASGIPVAAPSVVEPETVPPTEDAVIVRLWIKGRPTLESLADVLLCEPAAVHPLVEAAKAAGFVEFGGGTFRLTGAGKLHAGALVDEDRGRWGEESAAAALDEFIPLDQQMKEIVTAWQLRNGEYNDHADAAYDAQVMERLSGLHRQADAWLEALARGLPRLSLYRARLGRAHERACAGDVRYVASPRVDSYHDVWFELHEDLIRLSGRKRADEVAAGRA